MYRQMKPGLFFILLVITGGLYHSADAREAATEDTRLQITQAWIAEAPPVSRVMVAYMTISNDTAQDIVITKADSELYSSIEFHETIHEDGLAKMIRHDHLTIPAKGKLELKRGGAHMMLFNPKARLTTGDAVDLELSYQAGSGNDAKQSLIKTISVPVKKAQY